jgi:hypothetical protein
LKKPCKALVFFSLVPLLLACASAQERAWAHYTAGLEAAEAGRWEDCRHDYQASLATGYAAYGVHADYAVLLAREGRFDEAQVHLDEEARRHPQAAVLVARLVELIRQGREAQAPPQPGGAP